MHSLSRVAVQSLARQYGITPDRRQGQNFVIDQAVIDAMVASAGIKSGESVLEIGPGLGALSTALLEHGATLVAVEQDRRMMPALAKIAAMYPSLTVVSGDVFRSARQWSGKFQDRQYQLVANVPYNITSQIFRYFLEHPPRPHAITVLIQREVAERITAQPGAMSLLSVAVQLYAQPKIVRLVSPESFWPAPAVDSAILHVDGIGADERGFIRALGSVAVRDFFRVVRIGFSARRKQIHNTLNAGLQIGADQVVQALKTADISPQSRAQEVSIEQWIRLAHALNHR